MSVAQSGSIGKGAKNSTSTINIGSLPGLGPPARRGGQRQRARHLQSKQPTAFSFFFSHLLSFLAPTPKALLFAFGVFWLFFSSRGDTTFCFHAAGGCALYIPPPAQPAALLAEPWGSRRGAVSVPVSPSPRPPPQSPDPRRQPVGRPGPPPRCAPRRADGRAQPRGSRASPPSPPGCSAPPRAEAAPAGPGGGDGGSPPTHPVFRGLPVRGSRVGCGGTGGDSRPPRTHRGGDGAELGAQQQPEAQPEPHAAAHRTAPAVPGRRGAVGSAWGSAGPAPHARLSPPWRPRRLQCLGGEGLAAP